MACSRTSPAGRAGRRRPARLVGRGHDGHRPDDRGRRRRPAQPRPAAVADHRRASSTCRPPTAETWCGGRRRRVPLGGQQPRLDPLRAGRDVPRDRPGRRLVASSSGPRSPARTTTTSRRPYAAPRHACVPWSGLPDNRAHAAARVERTDLRVRALTFSVGTQDRQGREGVDAGLAVAARRLLGSSSLLVLLLRHRADRPAARAGPPRRHLRAELPRWTPSTPDGAGCSGSGATPDRRSSGSASSRSHRDPSGSGRVTT